MLCFFNNAPQSTKNAPQANFFAVSDRNFVIFYKKTTTSFYHFHQNYQKIIHLRHLKLQNILCFIPDSSSKPKISYASFLTVRQNPLANLTNGSIGSAPLPLTPVGASPMTPVGASPLTPVGASPLTPVGASKHL